ncbi:glutathione peroxidase [Nitzschia inconspicua]|uniref:Glutathione peroxidase n=1 Tax=Nitzschia inconspicua TaxID=303405 RepID=A0A9K3LK08_9STRA|nr:glutathione peroxidase [Nitzschia inconspicua]
MKVCRTDSYSLAIAFCVVINRIYFHHPVMLPCRRVTLIGLVLWAGRVAAFTSQPLTRVNPHTILFSENYRHNNNNKDEYQDLKEHHNNRRRDFFQAILGSGFVGMSLVGSASSALADDEEESFASIAARASKLSTEVGEKASVMSANDGDTRTAYDFELPVSGESVSFKDIVRQSLDEDGRSKVKAILVVNMKEDDPIARKDIPEFISLASKYGRNGDFAVVMSPSDQGYYEPDTSQLIRLKLASEYGYGINPATVVTDKVNFLGKTAHPFWRWLQKNCRTPAGLGRIEGNFEKFLIDGRTGLPVRRYPRKYMPLDIKNDIEALLAGRPLPPAGANYLEQWRSAAVEAERDTYRFQKGLNYYD